jgi:predicted DNA-binding transcriptional regulator AlpA
MQDLVPAGEHGAVAKRGRRKQQIAEACLPEAKPADDTVTMTIDATCKFFGGDRPLNPSTLYRGVRAGQYPPPVMLGPNNPRWLRSECMQALERLKKQRKTYSSSRWIDAFEPEAA